MQTYISHTAAWTDFGFGLLKEGDVALIHDTPHLFIKDNDGDVVMQEIPPLTDAETKEAT